MYRVLSDCRLFARLELSEIRVLFENTEYRLEQYAGGDVVALRGSVCHSLMILAQGRLRCEVGGNEGEASGLGDMPAPAVILPGLLYGSDNRMPVNLVADETAEIVWVKREVFTRMMLRNRTVLENFLELVSDNDRPLSDKVMFMGFKTIRGKFAHYLLEQAEKEGSYHFRLKLTQREMAEMFGVTRPALARVIGEMSDEGGVYVERKNVRIEYPEKLRQYARQK